MKGSSGESMNSGVLEKGILAHILRRCTDNPGNDAEIGRKIVGVISTIVRREHFQDPVLGRIFAAVKLWSSDAVLPLAAELYEMFRYVGDQEAAVIFEFMTSRTVYQVTVQDVFTETGKCGKHVACSDYSPVRTTAGT